MLASDYLIRGRCYVSCPCLDTGARARVSRGFFFVCLSFVTSARALFAQSAACDDPNIDAMRGRASVGVSDQRRITEWVNGQVDGFSSWKGFVGCFEKQVANGGNSPQFTQQLIQKTAEVAAGRFADPQLKAEVAHALARVLVNMNHVDTLPGLTAGLRHTDARTRFVCAHGFTKLRASIAADPAKLSQAVAALTAAGVKETSPAVLGRIYEALSHPAQFGAVFDAYLRMFDRRLDDRRKPGSSEDGAEIYAFEFFRNSAVINALTTEQKKRLLGSVAVFLRLDAQRYGVESLDFDELDKIERMLDAAEQILDSIVGDQEGGKVRDALSAGGHGNRRAVLQEAYRWVGEAGAKTKGALNAAPWNVAVGAP